MPFESPPPDHQRCKAKSKRSKERCKRYAEHAGVCHVHGAKSKRGKDSGTYVHGYHSKYIETAKLPEIAARIEELSTPAGRRDAIALGTAIIAYRADMLPSDLEYLELYCRASASIRNDIKILHDMDQAKAAETPAPVFQFYSAAQLEERWWRFSARGIDGVVSIQMIDGKPFIHDPENGHFVPAIEQIDPESQAKFYVRTESPGEIGPVHTRSAWQQSRE